MRLETDDVREVGEFTPDVRSWIAVNPDSELIPVTRANALRLLLLHEAGKALAAGRRFIPDWWTGAVQAMALHQLPWPWLRTTASGHLGCTGWKSTSGRRTDQASAWWKSWASGTRDSHYER